jgi:hypothetical protein
MTDAGSLASPHLGCTRTFTSRDRERRRRKRKNLPQFLVPCSLNPDNHVLEPLRSFPTPKWLQSWDLSLENYPWNIGLSSIP